MKLLIKELNKDPLLVMKLLIAVFMLSLVSEETDLISTKWSCNNVTDRTEEGNSSMISRKIMRQHSSLDCCIAFDLKYIISQ